MAWINEKDGDVIILEADGVVADDKGYGYGIAEQLKRLNFRPIVVSLKENSWRLDDLPNLPLIISGGMTEASADIPWVNEARDFVRKRISFNKQVDQAKKIPLLGICFGAQLIAESQQKGSVTYLNQPQMGVSTIKLDKQSCPLFVGYEGELPAYSFHYNQIKIDNVNIISSHKFSGGEFVQAYEIEDSYCYGVQFHPELTFPIFMQLIRNYQTLLENDLQLSIKEIEKNVRDIPANKQIFTNFMSLQES
ncbi:type 1 glutamine amidotransferase [Salinibacillus xinjiangensis]|nr:gamma-glutamyl-gamma-aminobutyrate hydrolase family protein [Salinibacillus xinjiangensis]